MVLTLITIIFGIIGSIQGTSKSPMIIQRSMKARIFFQGIAIVLFGILMYINKG
jgi:hypothetical protein